MHSTQQNRPFDVVIVDSDPGQRRILAGLISDGGPERFQPRSCASSAEAFSSARDLSDSIVLADLDTIGGPAHLSEIMRNAPRVIATSSTGSLNVALAAVKAGAIDFLAKPIGARALIEGLEAAVSNWNVKPADPRPAALREPPPKRPEETDFAGFIGQSPAMREVYDQIRRIAPSRAPVFITGESGTGKEVCAEAIHSHAGRGERPFVAINCSAIPRELMESEIFGHVRGAFTGASDNRVGAAELAQGGTLFLDEIAEMDLSLQAKLLRFVQTGALRRVGATDLTEVDVRIVSATNRDLFAEVEAGRFRADLFYRLHVLPIRLPPLRERGHDVLSLAEAFLARYAAEESRAFRGFDDGAAALIVSSRWPGNIRQLQNFIRQIVVLHDGDVVTAAMLPPEVSGPERRVPETEGPPCATPKTVAPYREQERLIIEGAIEAFGGSVPRAAAALELSPSTIYRKRQAWLSDCVR